MTDEEKIVKAFEELQTLEDDLDETYPQEPPC